MTRDFEASTGPTPNQRAAAQIRALMAARRKSGTELAALLGISQSAASRRVQGDGPFDLNEIVKIAEWLDVPLAGIVAPAPLVDFSQ